MWKMEEGEERKKKEEEESGDNTTKMRFPLSTRVQIEPSIPSDSIRLVRGNNVVSLLDTGKEILFFPEHPF